MRIQIPREILVQIHQHGEGAYPEEGAGLMLGSDVEGERQVKSLVTLANAREESARYNRYLITAEDMFKGEMEAEKMGMIILGIFHSHPDHPNQPSEFDLEFAIPWYSYLITSVFNGKAEGSKSWRMKDDRSGFQPEEIIQT